MLEKAAKFLLWITNIMSDKKSKIQYCQCEISVFKLALSVCRFFLLLNEWRPHQGTKRRKLVENENNTSEKEKITKSCLFCSQRYCLVWIHFVVNRSKILARKYCDFRKAFAIQYNNLLWPHSFTSYSDFFSISIFLFFFFFALMMMLCQAEFIMSW